MDNSEILPISKHFLYWLIQVGGFNAAEIKISILVNYSVELKQEENNCLVLVLLNAGIFCTLMHW